MRSRGSVTNLKKRQEQQLKKLPQIGPFLRGSLCTATRGNHTAHQLTVSIKGKTHTVYVPVDMVSEVKAWINNYRKAQRLMEEMSKTSMAIIHRHVPEGRGDGRRRERPRRRR